MYENVKGGLGHPGQGCHAHSAKNTQTDRHGLVSRLGNYTVQFRESQLTWTLGEKKRSGFRKTNTDVGRTCKLDRERPRPGVGLEPRVACYE